MMQRKKTFLGIRFFQVSYSLFLFLSITSIFISKQSDVIWIWIWLFYMPFVFFGFYFYGFAMGILTQFRLKSTVKQLFSQAGIYFLLSLLLTLLSYLCFAESFDFLRDPFYTFYPANGSSLLFIVGSLLTKWIQKKTSFKDKQKSQP